MSNFLYIIANLNNINNIWMNSTPFIELKGDKNEIILQMLRDISINFLETENSIIEFSIYRIRGPIRNFFNKRDMLFKNINFLPQYAEEIGFEKMNDFKYIVDESNKTQISNGFQITFSYIKDKIFDNKIYLANPTIVFQ
jgi:hypothetical protein